MLAFLPLLKVRHTLLGNEFAAGTMGGAALYAAVSPC
jgi:hypothetical protein